MRLRAARAFSQRVSGWEIARTKSPVLVKEATENPGPGWFEEFVSGEFPADFLAICQMDKEKLINLVRNVWELECLVRALDSIETLSSVAGLSREYDPPSTSSDSLTLRLLTHSSQQGKQRVARDVARHKSGSPLGQSVHAARAEELAVGIQ
jgi:hypothetical protein